MICVGKDCAPGEVSRARRDDVRAYAADTGAVINALPFAAGADDARTGFMGEVRRDGLDL